MLEPDARAGGRAGLPAHMEDLARTLAVARAELRQLGAGPLLVERIPSARDELTAVVAHTASATDVMLDIGEELDRMQGRDDALLQQATTRIFEACSFQDLTSQRIVKVLGTLRLIEQKLEDIFGLFGIALHAAPAAGGHDDGLVNGPQLPGFAMPQAEVDRLLAS